MPERLDFVSLKDRLLLCLNMLRPDLRAVEYTLHVCVLGVLTDMRYEALLDKSVRFVGFCVLLTLDRFGL